MTSPPYMVAGCPVKQPRALPHLPPSSSLLSGLVRTAWYTGMCIYWTYLLVVCVCLFSFLYFFVSEYSKSVHFDIKHAIFFPLLPK